MPHVPWWIEPVGRLLAPVELETEPGPLWAWCERVGYIRDNVDGLEEDFAAAPEARALWSRLGVREGQVQAALKDSVERVASALRTGALAPAAFRATWERLGFTPHAEGGGTPADDHLDAITQVARLTLGEPTPHSGNVNMSSRAERIADFLKVTEPGPEDRVFDLGSGSGKLAITVAASTSAQVQGVELGGSYVEAAKRSAAYLGLRNCGFTHADVRDVDLSAATVFYLYHPFYGDVARTIAQSLGRLARNQRLTLYVIGPGNEFGEHFLRQTEPGGALKLVERRGEFSDALILRSA